MALVAIAQEEPIERAIERALAAESVGAKLLGFTVQGVRHLWEAARLNIGESDLERMEFPGMSLQEAIGAFTQAAYGERLDFEHA